MNPPVSFFNAFISLLHLVHIIFAYNAMLSRVVGGPALQKEEGTL